MRGTFAAVDEFMTAEALDIGERERGALVKVLGMLEAGELQHVPAGEYRYQCEPTQFTKHFNMRHWRDVAPCGTVCCIGGTAEMIGADFGLLSNTPSSVRILFFPNYEGIDMDTITPAQAAAALRSYLTFGEPMWSNAMKILGVRTRDRNLAAQLSECQAST